MKTNQLRAMMLTVMLVITTLGGTVWAQPLIVKGTVTDGSDGSPLVGCAVTVKGTSRGAVTNLQGQYRIEANKGETLIFSYIGFDKVEKVVFSAKMDVSLKASSDVLEECVVVGYGSQRKVAVTGAISTVNLASLRHPSVRMDAVNTEEYKSISENGFKQVGESPLSTFSIDVDAASYSNMRRMINSGTLPVPDAIRTEELVNYFSYDYAKPTGSDPVKITMEAGVCPWNADHRLVRIGLKAREIPTDKLPESNLVFLIDVSGSMWGPTRLDLVKSSLKLLVNNLREKDKVAIVVYAGNASVKLESTPGSDKQKIRDAIDELTSGGSTAGGAGIQLAYKVAKQNFLPKGNNRIILCSDGDFNVGVSSVEGLEQLIEKERKSGVFLSVLGYGMGNYKDNKGQALAEKGNGNHAYIDNLQEANRVLVGEFGATLHTVAKDVKLQVEFNPAQVQAYRLVGYESRLLKDEDFNNDAKDAGELGAGHTVTAFYEVIPVYNPQIQISAESETKRSIFREKDKTKRSKKESAQHSKSRNKSFVMTSVSAL